MQDTSAMLRRPLDVKSFLPEVELELSKLADEPTTALINERETTHGDFDENARMWQGLCEMASHTRFENDRQRLAINMIFLKIARMMQNPNVRDHWDDIAGYARLGADGCK
jgi:hypothetical protein